MTDEAELYRRRGPAYEAAWEILMSGCDVAPSLEGFDHLVREMRQQVSLVLPVETVAERIVMVDRPFR